MTTKQQCKRYMINQLNACPELYTEFISGSINSTLLAEDCADHFLLYEADPCQSSDTMEYLPADFIFDLAVDIALAHERKHQ